MFNLGVHNAKTPTEGSCSGITCKNDDNLIKFSKMDAKETWMPNNPNGKTSMSDKEKYDFVNAPGDGVGAVSRCDWVKCCGAESSTKGVWQGVESTCSYNPSATSITAS
jgi:hypothetical protein